MTRKAIAVDLDGTLCLRNTFNIFLRQLVYAHRFRLLRLAELCAWMGARRLRLISQARMKRHILGRFCPPSPTLVDSVVDTVWRHANPEVTALVDRCRREGYATILATAAPEAYVSAIARRFGLEYCIATPQPDSWKAWGEARGCAKRDAVVRLAEEKSLVLDIAVSDHADDMPLLEAAATAILVELPVGNLRRI